MRNVMGERIFAWRMFWSIRFFFGAGLDLFGLERFV